MHLREWGVVPRLAVALPSRDEASRTYLRAKERVAAKLGVDIESVTLQHPSTKELVSLISAWVDDETVSGIMVETPIPPEIDMEAVRRVLPARKDVDGAGTESFAQLLAGTPVYPAATAAAALALAETVDRISGKHAVVIGRSLVVGRPLALLLLARDATVTICHSKTRDLAAIARDADILFVAMGRPTYVTGEFVKPGATVIDIGTNIVADGTLVGDVDAASVEPIASALSPVPGGVGPVTTTVLLEHVIAAAEAAANLEGAQ
jgi:methylenetetrahydrofolate dehydrogenase (NADP+)/methenyltetrahydrofolate cyclohydrolase